MEKVNRKVKHKQYCAAFGCLNNNKNPNIQFFKLPVDVKRQKKWLTLIDREDLLQKKDFKHSSYCVCSSHFEESSFKTIKKLTADAFPLPTNATTVAAETQTCENVSMKSSSSQTSKIVSNNASRKRKLACDLKTKNLKRRSLEREIKKIKTEFDSHNSSLMCEDPENEVGRKFCKLIEWLNSVKNKYKDNRYDNEYNFFALSLYYLSPWTYRCLQTVLKFPTQSTLKRLKLKISPKLDNQVLESLKLKIKSLPNNAKYCTICIGEMEIKSNLYYDIKSDEVIGFHNVNGKVSPEIASNALGIVLQGIYCNWQQPIAYALLASVKDYDEVDSLLTEVITKLSGIGIEVRAIISDQGPNFDKFAKCIKKVTIEKPYFMYNDRKIYYIFDVPHLIKCLHHNLLTSDFYYGDQKISWDFIKQLYNDQKEKKLRLLPKLTDSHLELNNINKMQVRLALQIFSNTVAAALHTYIDLDKMATEARPTAHFLEAINNLFDVLNSSKFKSKNKFQSAFQLTKDQEKVLYEAQKYFTTIKVINKKTGKNNTSYIKLYGNFQISIQAIKMMYEDLKREGFSFLLTSRLNQDNLEKFFRSVRQQGGFCSDPTAIQFQRAFSKLFLCNMIKNSPATNGEVDICDVLLKAEDIFKLDHSNISPVESKPSAVRLNGNYDYRMDLPHKNALTYVSGFLLFKCLETHKCSNINIVLKSVPELSETNLYTKYKAYNKKSTFFGGLKMPPKEFIDYVGNLETVFTKNFDKVIQKKNPGSQLLELFRAVPPQTLCDCFPSEYLLKLFVRLRIYATLRFNNRHFKDGEKILKQYLKIRHL